MDRLIEGYRRFRAEAWPAQRARYQRLSIHGQKPQTLVIACSDSRVDPSTVFGAGPGELFVVRNVAALIPRYRPDGGCHGASAALEFAVRVLKVAQIVVLGHAQCGGVQALVEGAPPEAQDFVAPWMAAASAALRDAGDRDLEHYEGAVVRLSLENLMSFPWVADAVAEGRLSLHGCRFDIHDGVLSRLENGRFIPIT